MRLSRALLCLLVPAVLSCNSLESNSGPGIALYLELSATTVPLGGSIDATIIARNVGTTPLILTGPSDCLLYVEAYNNRSQRVFTSASQCLGNVVEEELAPGASKTATTTWAGTSTAGSRLPSGIYHLRVAALLPSGAWVQPGSNIDVE